MAEVVTMPRLSDTMEEGTVAKWHKKVGDKVSEGDLLAEIETDKATMDFESFQEGTLLHIGIEEGSTAPVDSILAILGEEGEDISGLLDGDSGSAKTESKEEKSEDKNTEEKKESVSKDEKEEGSSEKKESTSEKSSSDADGRIKASPLAKKMAADKGIDLNKVKGSGENGRIVKQDIDNYKESAPSAAAAAVVGAEESYEEVTVSQMRKTIAKRLSESKFTAPHFYLTLDIDMDAAIEARKSINSIAESKISFNDLVIKAVAAALKKHPAVNSSWLGNKIRINHHVHIGVAVAVEDGLLVPVIRHADQKGLTTINAQVKELAEKAKKQKASASRVGRKYLHHF